MVLPHMQGFVQNIAEQVPLVFACHVQRVHSWQLDVTRRFMQELLQPRARLA